MSDGSVEHGPWAAEACSRLLIRWLNAGFVGVYRLKPDQPGGEDLPTDAARDALTAHETWPDVRDLFPFATDAGETADYDAWRAVAE